MAIVTLGTTTRGGTVIAGTFTQATTGNYGLPPTLPAIALKNALTAGSGSLVLGILHGVSIAPQAYKFFTTNDFDDRTRFNPRNHNVDTVSTDGKKPYLDDVNELAKLIANGTIQVYLATQTVSSNTFTLGTTASYTVAGDGSIFFA